MKNIPIYDVPLLVRVGVLMFQVFMSLLLGMMFYVLYRLIAKGKKEEFREVLSLGLVVSAMVMAVTRVTVSA